MLNIIIDNINNNNDDNNNDSDDNDNDNSVVAAASVSGLHAPETTGVSRGNFSQLFTHPRQPTQTYHSRIAKLTKTISSTMCLSNGDI